MHESLTAFQESRPRLQALAYRLLGSRAEAEDVVQEAWLRFSHHTEPLDSPAAWLTTVTTRLAVDALRRARLERERYVGPWLPEPVDDPAWLGLHANADPERAAALSESVSMAFLVVLEALSPLERAAYVLHRIFEYSAEEVAAVLERSPAAVRQLCHRAEAHVAAGRPRFTASREAHQAVLAAFAMAVATGDVSAVERLLVAEVVLTSDGGGARRAALRPILGSSRAARFLEAIRTKSPLRRVEVRDLNGAPALLWETSNGDQGALTLETDGQQVYGIQLVINPAKLALLRALG